MSVNPGLLAAILVPAILLLAGGAFAVAMNSYCDKLFAKIYRRPRPLPQVDRSPKSIDQSTIFGRGRNWFYTYRNEWLNVSMHSFDGTALSAYFRPSSDRSCRNMVILIHGYNEQPSQMAAYAKLLMKKVQCNCLILHMRSHGMSGGKYFTYGLRESVDLEPWFEFTRKRLGDNCRIYICARGIGATAALLAAQQPGFCPNVCGIIADSPASSLTGVLRSAAAEEYHMRPDFFLYRIRKLTSKRFGFDINMCDCALNAGKIKVPVLIFEGGDDHITVPSEVRGIYDNLRSAKRMIVVDGAGHLESYERAQALYEKEVQKFIESCVVRLVKIGRL
ncbi:MAG: hypothetical protein LKG18_07480 [Saccharofermentans sp.]|jgi:pimeloyl-ACP methyl ester carboxylesterase|nr:hypothetical protein [Saccharofermentans sp.]MCI1768956.1 hypothetical protein [Mageeibacillus sp.]